MLGFSCRKFRVTISFFFFKKKIFNFGLEFVFLLFFFNMADVEKCGSSKSYVSTPKKVKKRSQILVRGFSFIVYIDNVMGMRLINGNKVIIFI